VKGKRGADISHRNTVHWLHDTTTCTSVHIPTDLEVPCTNTLLSLIFAYLILWCNTIYVRGVVRFTVKRYSLYTQNIRIMISALLQIQVEVPLKETAMQIYIFIN